MGKTIVVCEEPKKRIIMAIDDDPLKALKELVEKGAEDCEKITIYKTIFYASLSRQALLDLTKGLAVEEAGEARQVAEAEARKPTAVAAVFDQMFKGFADVVARETGGTVEFHEIVGRGLERPVKTGRVYRQPARDDYDVLKLLEELAKEKKVLFFTGDKRLASQAEMIPNVHVEYMPPGEFTGKEAAIRRMVERIREAVENSRKNDELPR